jgi:glycerol-3-phosphate dehydrogenase
MKRDDAIGRLRERRGPWDILVIGGGATGLGIAVDAASRGHDVAVVERGDFGCGTSSRSTKLLHGGLRYLRQGSLSLVREALRERAILRAAAPHCVHPITFAIPCHGVLERAFYGVGTSLYDLLSSGSRDAAGGFARSRIVSSAEILRRLPGLSASPGGRPLRGGVLYADGQFDDARLAVDLAATAISLGGCVANQIDTVALVSRGGRIGGAVLRDRETGESFDCLARGVVNATGPFCDAVRRLDDPHARPIIAASQGVHVVLPSWFLPGDTALIVPKTPDGRVVFAIPWRDRVVVGTTDTPIASPTPDPRPLAGEIDFLLDLAAGQLAMPPSRADILACFTGIRPLVAAGSSRETKSLPRDHAILVSPSGLLTITGGKWTTYRRMAEDAVDRVEAVAGLSHRPCTTRSLRIHGSPHDGTAAWRPSHDPLAVYGTDAESIRKLAAEDPRLAVPIHASLPTIKAQVVWAVREEMARTVDDVLSRRTRDLVVDARAAIEAAPVVSSIMAAELGRDEAWQRSQVEAFRVVAETCLP